MTPAAAEQLLCHKMKKHSPTTTTPPAYYKYTTLQQYCQNSLVGKYDEVHVSYSLVRGVSGRPDHGECVWHLVYAIHHHEDVRQWFSIRSSFLGSEGSGYDDPSIEVTFCLIKTMTLQGYGEAAVTTQDIYLKSSPGFTIRPTCPDLSLNLFCVACRSTTSLNLLDGVATILVRIHIPLALGGAYNLLL